MVYLNLTEKLRTIFMFESVCIYVYGMLCMSARGVFLFKFKFEFKLKYLNKITKLIIFNLPATVMNHLCVVI